MLPVGRVSKLFGRKGELLVNLYDSFPADFKIEEPLFVRIDSLAVPLFMEHFERRGRSGALLSFADLDNEVRASELVGLELLLRERVPDGEAEDDEIYMEDLVGFRARLADGVEGEIEGFEEGENPLFRIGLQGREVLVPAVDDFIASFDLTRRVVVFSLPEGLLELYTE